MADIHMMGGDGKGNWSFICHAPVPATTNSSSVLWSTALVGSGQAQTSLTEGTEAWEISAAEKAEVEAGTVLEFSFSFPAESGGASAAQVLAAVRYMYAQKKDEAFDRLQSELKWFGWAGSAT